MNNFILLLKKKRGIYKNNNRIPKSSNGGDNRIIHCAPYEACLYVQRLMYRVIACKHLPFPAPPPKTNKTFYMKEGESNRSPL